VVDDEEGIRPGRTEWHMRRLQALADSINGAALRHTIAIVNDARSDIDGSGRPRLEISRLRSITRTTADHDINGNVSVVVVPLLLLS
jgi:hypothetical protein